jgi:CO dehydrogenase maturation factor
MCIRDSIPTPLIDDAELIRSRVGQGMISLTPEVDDLPERLSVRVGNANLLVMGSVAGAGGGCACEANALLKALVAHLVLTRDQWLVVVSEPSLRSLTVAARVASMAAELGLARQALVLNRAQSGTGSGAAADPWSSLPDIPGLPPLTAVIPPLPGLMERMLARASVLDLPERPVIDAAMDALLAALGAPPEKPQPAR